MDCLIVLRFIIILTILFAHVQCFSFRILHNNDMHARYDPVTNSCQRCPAGDDERGLCFGGFGRVATVVKRARANGPMLYLNAGDTFYGTNWYTAHKGELAADLLNIIHPDAVSLGNHELDDDLAGFTPFLRKVNFPIVCCNLDLRKTPDLHNFRTLVRATVIRKFKQNIGIIGYITPNTKYYVPYNSISYSPEISTINIEAKRLLNQGVNIIIALGHSGFEMDKMIAEHCPDVDVVIGGHSHTFLYTGSPPDIEKPDGNYPTIVTKSNGRKVPVLQAYAFTKYMGIIDLEFDDYGHLANFSGKPILLDKSIPHHPDITKILNAKRQQVDFLDAKDIKDNKSRIKMFYSEEFISNTPDYISTIVNIAVFMFLLIIFVCNDRHVLH
ncbi:protein 5NUC [Drosophila mojavensis]|uniref:5'-nucleotidase n=1 Tax=Drosophila mojavensis TaxID=7230 RepID=B4KQY3_DROMO|nr:protein 5NUC [Drosophila mojavensis]EDW10339.2 uncharacterized protein Dmoj_GI18585 [Drosophila mojavensis]